MTYIFYKKYKILNPNENKIGYNVLDLIIYKGVYKNKSENIKKTCNTIILIFHLFKCFFFFYMEI